jgi:hypothetical protein
MPSMRLLRPDRSRIVYDVLDGQVLIIRSDTGAYYSLDGTAAEVWVAIMGGADEAGVVEALCQRYPTAAADIETDVAAFLDQLLAESLLVEGEVPADEVEEAAIAASPHWAPPALEAFNDMRDLLLFDPIHEVGPEGWPHAANDRG